LCKLSAVVSRLAGHQTARAVIEAMIAGERDPRVLAALGQGKMRNGKLPALAEALSGMRFGPRHAHAAASLLRAIDLLDAELRDLEERVTAHLAAIPASWGVDSDGVTGPAAGRAGDAAALPAADRLDEIPGLGREAAAALIAEIGLDMSRFPTPQALVSWAGLTPTARQSGPRKGRGKKGHGREGPLRAPGDPLEHIATDRQVMKLHIRHPLRCSRPSTALSTEAISCCARSTSGAAPLM
jgi:transposase